MRALITNDDGIGSEGLRTLAAVAVEAGLETVVVAPSWDSSGASASLTAVLQDGRLSVTPTQLDGLPDVVASCAEAAPAFIVRTAMTGAFGPPPDLVLSGVNRGPNVGHAVLHSGTVGAALTASTHGRPAIAFSLDAPAAPRWHTAAAVAREVVAWFVSSGPAVVLNVNVPDVEPDEVRGLEAARLAAYGSVQTTVTEVGEGYVSLADTVVDEVPEPGTDAALLAGGTACYTALSAACEAPGAALTGLGRR
ncbi:MAG TPA: 5'/3'-nucleotidase SurE [Acidimicrobiales bacterium]|nr:5'/3'-nucleotidase SurE [Acidimicrobiales bacterium]